MRKHTTAKTSLPPGALPPAAEPSVGSSSPSSSRRRPPPPPSLILSLFSFPPPPSRSSTYSRTRVIVTVDRKSWLIWRSFLVQENYKFLFTT